jgi:uncharacterized protein
LILFVAAAYLLAWLCFGVPILAVRGLIPLPAPEAAFLTLATLGVCLAGVGAAAAESARSGVRALLAQVLRWRVRAVWYLAAVFVPAPFPAGGFLLSLALGHSPPPGPPLQAWLSLPLLLLALVTPAVLEEVGWRGYALPRLQRRFGWLRASVALGVIWAGLHPAAVAAARLRFRRSIHTLVCGAGRGDLGRARLAVQRHAGKSAADRYRPCCR